MAIADLLRGALAGIGRIANGDDDAFVTRRSMAPLVKVLETFLTTVEAAIVGGDEAGNLVALDEAGKLPAVDGSNLTGITSGQVSGLGTAATRNVGTALTNVVGLIDVGGGLPGLPAVDASNLTGITADQIAGLGGATSTSYTVEDIGDSATETFNIPIAGSSRGVVDLIIVTKTSGDSTSFQIGYHRKTDRSDSLRPLMGDASTGLWTGDFTGGIVVGPHIRGAGGLVMIHPVQVVNIDGGQLCPLTFTNGADAGTSTFQVEVVMRPLPEAA